jgi:hypothetical protein
LAAGWWGRRRCGEIPGLGRPTAESRRAVVVGLVASEGLAAGIAEELAESLPAALGERFEDREWRLELSDEALPITPSTGDELMAAARDRLRARGWVAGAGFEPATFGL